MLIISFDAVGNREFERLLSYPTFSQLAGQSAVFRDVSTVFVSNTYPIHSSVATGLVPGAHKLTANTETFPARNPVWHTREDEICARTLWQAAAQKGIKTAAVFWPVTAYSKTIRYNVPEVLARPGKSQLLTSLKAGSTALQLKLFLRHHSLLDGINQPSLDAFATACMVDILREHKPGLALIHFTAYDSLCHQHGKESPQLTQAYEALDKNLAALLAAAAGEHDIVIFSDHDQRNVHSVVTLNDLLIEKGLLSASSNGTYMPGESGCHIECCGGAAFFHAGTLPSSSVEEVRETVAASEGFCRFLTATEMHEAGRQATAFGFCPKIGYCYEPYPTGHKADHGYPADAPDYTVFYMIKSPGFEPGSSTRGGSLLDIAPTVAQCLDLDW